MLAITHVLVEVALIAQSFQYSIVTPHGPMVLGDQHPGLRSESVAEDDAEDCALAD
jgi:hypothetical protein